MTPAEKARDLVHKFYVSLPNNGGFTGINNINSRWIEGTQCALMAVEEILLGYMGNPKVRYWEEVKQEIEKL